MRKVIIVFFWSLIGFSLNAFSQVKTSFPEVSFFEGSVFFEPGLIGVSSFTKVKGTIPQLPGFRYFHPEKGLAQIICYPRNLQAWRRKVKDILDLKQYATQNDKIKNEIKKISLNTALRKEYLIYAFYTERKNVVIESDLQNKVAIPKFPCYIYTYKLNGTKWIPVKKAMVTDYSGYMSLMYQTIAALVNK